MVFIAPHAAIWMGSSSGSGSDGAALEALTAEQLANEMRCMGLVGYVHQDLLINQLWNCL